MTLARSRAARYLVAESQTVEAQTTERWKPTVSIRVQSGFTTYTSDDLEVKLDMEFQSVDRIA